MNIKTTIKDNIVFILLAAAAFMAFIMGTLNTMDSDFFHIFCSGRWICENNAIMQYNESFVEEGYKTIVQQWLYSIVVYVSYNYMGIAGLNLLVISQFLSLSFIIYKLLRLTKVDAKSATISVILTMFVMIGYINCRPQMISLILLYGELYCLERYRQTGKQTILYFLPLLSLLEINLHCTFWIFHYIFILPYVVPANKLIKAFFKRETAIEDNTIGVKPLIAPMLLMAVSLFVNPYGLDAVLCLFRSSSISSLEIVELEPLALVSEGMAYLILATITLIYLYKSKRLTSATLYTTLGTAILYIGATRNVIFFSIAAALICKDAFKERDLKRFYAFVTGENNKKAIAFSAAAIVAVTAYGFGKDLFPKTTANNLIIPMQAVEYITENEEDLATIRMFTDLNTGSYFLYHRIGKVYIEPKTEPYVGEINGVKDIISEYSHIKEYATYEDISAFVNEYDFDYIYVPYHFAALQVYLEMAGGYECVVVSDATIEKNGMELPQYRLYKKL